MFDSQSHQSGGAPVGDMADDEAETRRGSAGRRILPEGLGEMAPGPALAAFLSTVDFTRLRGDDALTALRARRRQASHELGAALALPNGLAGGWKAGAVDGEDHACADDAPTGRRRG